MNQLRSVCRYRRGREHGAVRTILLVAALLAAMACPVASSAADIAQVSKIREITVAKTPYYTNIEASIDGKIENYNSFKLNDPFRIVVDIWGVAPGSAAPEIAVNTPQVKSVKVSQQEKKLRLLIETPNDKPLPFLVSSEGGKVVLSVGGGADEKVTSLDREKAKEGVKGPAIVGVDLEDMPAVSNVVVTTANGPEYTVEKSDARVVLVFPKASVSDRGLLRTLKAESLNIPVLNVTTSTGKKKKGSRVTVNLVPGSKFEVEKKGDAVVISFPKSGGVFATTTVARMTPQTEGNGGVPTASTVAKGEESAVYAPWEDGKTPGKLGFLTASTPSKVGKYSGSRISLDFKDADLANVFRIISEVANLNLVTADDVGGKISLRLTNVPWDQALDLVLRSKGLGAVQEGNIIRIAQLSKLQKEEDDLASVEKKKDDAIQAAKKRKYDDEVAERKRQDEDAARAEKARFEREAITEGVAVNFGEVADIAKKVEIYKSELGKISVDTRTSTFYIYDFPEAVENVKKYKKELDKPMPQVLIEARIVEVDTGYSEDFGVQWGAGGSRTRGQTTIGIGGIMDSSGAWTSAPVNGANPLNFAVNLPAAVGQGSGGGFSFGVLRDNMRLDMSISALEAQGKGKIISSPKVVTIDNKLAKIEQGVQIPYSTVSSSGTSTQFIDATLSLEVTPRITPDGSVIMKVKAKNDSQGAAGADGKPAINKKLAETEVLVGDGQTSVIGGIMQITRQEDTAGVPYLSKIPYLGALFRKNSSSSQNRELLVFITPKVLKSEFGKVAGN